MKINLKIDHSKKIYTPNYKDFLKWSKIIFKNKKTEITIKLLKKKKIKLYNKKYKKKNKITNVLTFPLKTIFNLNDHPLRYYLGDIIICSQYVNEEAKKYNKKKKERWAHIFIHASLHLLKYKHNTQLQKKKMEKKEKKIMFFFGYKDPYIKF